jgi:predicted permease
MSWLDGLAHRMRIMLNPRSYERDLEIELQHHLDLDAAQLRDVHGARRRFGNRTYYIEETRRMTWLGVLDLVEQDARFAWRSLKRNPGVTALIVMTFTLGIGVNAATFSLLDRIYLRPPVGVRAPHSVRRVWVSMQFEGGRQFVPSLSGPLYAVIRRAWGDSNRVALFTHPNPAQLGGTRRGRKVEQMVASSGYWSILGLTPQLGRFYTAEEDRTAPGVRVAVLSDQFWRAQFGGDSDVIGKSLRLDAQRYTIVGVAPAGFVGDNDLEPVDVWLPLATYQPEWMKEPILESNSMYVFQAIARAGPNDNLEVFDQRATQAVRGFYRSLKNGGDTLMTVTTGSIIYARGPGQQQQEHLISTRLSAVALIVLIIAAANVINLLLARATRRRREIAVRLALGVGRWRLVRLLTGETLLLTAIAAVASVLAAWWGETMLRRLLLPDVRFTDSAINLRIIVFTLGIAAVVGLIAGIVPALQASNPNLTSALKEGAREGTVQRSRLRTTLVMTQAALSVVLLVGAALFVQSLRNVRAVNIGYDAPRTVIGSVDFDAGQSPPSVIQDAHAAEVAQRMENAPGVVAVARATNVPMYGFSVTTIWIGSDSTFPVKKSYPALNVVTRTFFAATGLRLIRGSNFLEDRGAPPQVVINEAMAQQIWSGADPLGQCIRFDGRMSACYTVVGIVETSRRDNIIEDPVPQYYLPITNLPKSLQDWSHGTVLLVRAAADAAPRVEATLTQALKATFPGGYPNVKLLSDVIDRQYRPWRVGAALFTGFGVLALIVAVVGIYGTVSYAVSQRTHEFGVRIALGARVADVLRLVLGDGLRTVVIGVVIGAALAIAAGRLVATLLYGVAPTNPLVLVTVSLTLLVVAAAATLVPAWRAGRVDPMLALRAE